MRMLDEARKLVEVYSVVDGNTRTDIRTAILTSAKKGSHHCSIELNYWHQSKIEAVIKWLEEEGFQANVRAVKIEGEGARPEIISMLDISFS